MAPYLIAFLFSSALFQFGGLAEFKHGNAKAAFLLYGFAFLPLCILAGARDLSVGTDTGGYGIFLFDQGMSSTSFGSYVEALDNSTWDVAPLYAFVTYLVVRIFQSQIIYFAAIELFVVFPVFIVCRKLCPQRIGISMLLYLLVFFIPSLNMMRQSASMGLAVLAVEAFVDGKKLKATLWLICAVSIHYSAIIAVLFCLMWFALVKRDKMGAVTQRPQARFVIFVLVVLVFAVMLFFQQIAEALGHLDGFGRLFLYATHSGSKLSSSGLVYDVLLIFGSLSIAFHLHGSGALRVRYYALLVSLSFAFFCLSGIDNTISRMMSFCTIFFIPLASILLNRFGYRNVPAGFLLLICACLFRFFVCYGLQGFGDAVPYTSTVLGI